MSNEEKTTGDHPTASGAFDQNLLETILDSWDRNNTILLNLLRGIPMGGMEARAVPNSPSVAQMFTHIHFVRLVFVLEESAQTVRNAVKGRLETNQGMNLHYDQPILLLQHMIWHEGYHHGQIKLALKLTGSQIPDDAVGAGTWGVWMNKGKPRVER